MPNRPAAPANHARTQRLSVAARWGAPLLLSGLTVAVVAQGAYYLWAQVAVAALIGAALIVTPGVTRLTSSDRAIVLPAGALAAWALLVAVWHANPLAAAPYVGLLAGVVAVLIACSRFGEDASDSVAHRPDLLRRLRCRAGLAGRRAARPAMGLARAGAVAGLVHPDLPQRHRHRASDAGPAGHRPLQRTGTLDPASARHHRPAHRAGRDPQPRRPAGPGRGHPRPGRPHRSPGSAARRRRCATGRCRGSGGPCPRDDLGQRHPGGTRRGTRGGAGDQRRPAAGAPSPGRRHRSCRGGCGARREHPARGSLEGRSTHG